MTRAGDKKNERSAFIVSVPALVDQVSSRAQLGVGLALSQGWGSRSVRGGARVRASGWLAADPLRQP